MSYYEGVLTQARIQNDLDILREMAPGTFNMLGVKKAATAAVEITV
jgi:hypothetical protein